MYFEIYLIFFIVVLCGIVLLMCCCCCIYICIFCLYNLVDSGIGLELLICYRFCDYYSYWGRIILNKRYKIFIVVNGF